MTDPDRDPNPATPRFWRSLAERSGTLPDGAAGEFPPGALDPDEGPASEVSRRRFLGLAGASAALAATAACTRVDRGLVVPYTKRPLEIVPGVADFYASTFAEGLRAHGILVKTREGRPIHVEGNDEHPRARGKAPWRAIADLLGLYDPDRLREPHLEGKPATWAAAMGNVIPVLRGARDTGASVLLLSRVALSPSRRALLAELMTALPGLRHVAWEPALPGVAEAVERELLGEALLARRRYDRARVIAAFEDDFLSGEDPDAVALFASRRRPEKPEEAISRLWVVEGRWSVTGTNADERLTLPPSQAPAVLFAIARELHEAHGIALPPGVDAAWLSTYDLRKIAQARGWKAGLAEALARDLAGAGRESLVVAGAGLPAPAHAAAVLLNAMCGAEGSTIETARAVPAPPIATLEEMRGIAREMAEGRFAAAIFWGVNPAYAFPDADTWKAAAGKVPLRVAIALEADETAGDCQVILPENHWLESWGDHEPAMDFLTLQQPAVAPLYDTKQGEDVLLEFVKGLGGSAPADFRSCIRARWEREVYPAGSPVPFEAFWNASLHDGVRERAAVERTPRVLAGEKLAAYAGSAAPSPAGEGMELALHPGHAVWDGRYANNGWLQELPDPVTKMTWGNPVLVSPADAALLGVRDGEVVRVEAGGRTVEAPVLVQPGEAPGVISLALGYGRRTGSVANGVGTNAWPLLGGGRAQIRKTGTAVPLPTTQWHHRMEGRDIVRTVPLAGLGHEAGHPGHVLHSLYPDPKWGDHKWGMVVDLSACVGCGGCVIACQSENNIPVVGPERVARGREMHWIRVDRYYEGPPDDPRVVHQPMVCQHCDNAPCENVCPVNATSHSPDGLNQMAYNRCVGTRYCANNCPYRVRRFNFFEYNKGKKEPESLVFNPEVSVRPRGVMEKCTFCVQRIDDARVRARTDGRALRDGEFTTACAAACPADAIVFGNLQDTESRVTRLSASGRGYKVLEELGVRPAVTYLARVTSPASEGERHEG